MDEFAQSREDDDLFADEFEPVAQEQVPIVEPEPVHQPVAAPSQQHQQLPSQHHQESRGDFQARVPGQGRGRGRGGRGGRGGAQNGLSASRFAAPATEITSGPKSQPQQPIPTKAHTTAEPTTDLANDISTPQNAASSSEPIQPQPQRTHAVRGDRSATGGPAVKKLTEEELTAKLEKMAILNKEKSEKHRLTEADQAAFQNREKESAKERKQKAVAERKDQRVMEMERAKNRERKMKAQQGREWDSEKLDSDIVDRTKGRSSEYVRGGHGGVIREKPQGLAGSRFAGEDEGLESNAGRGNGFQIRGRGSRGGRGNGRGGKFSTSAVPTSEDFPALPGPEKVKSPIESKPDGDWAEEMATPVEEKKSLDD